MPEPVKYRSLGPDEIRLLRFTGRRHDPSHPDDSPIVELELEHHNRHSLPPYSALSYAWGGAHLTKPIIVGGRTCEVGVSAAEALFQLQEAIIRATDRSSSSAQEEAVPASPPPRNLIWIDQLCINQSDEAEKSSQVQLMRHIYEDATEAIVWLGPADDDSEALTSHLRVLSDVISEGDINFALEMHADASYRAAVNSAWHRFCEKPYWKRMWVIQEFAVAQTVRILMGSTFLPHVALTRALRFANRLLGVGDPLEIPPERKELAVVVAAMYKTPATSYAESVAAHRARFRNDDEMSRRPLLGVLVAAVVLEVDYNYRLTTDHRDRIFSLVHLAVDAEEWLTVFPDYSMTCQQVYEEAAFRFLEQGWIDVLSYVQFPKDLGDLPSWVPDWSMRVRWPCCSAPWYNEFSASSAIGTGWWQEEKEGYRQVIKRVGDYGKRLSLRGFRADKVSHVGEVLWDPDWLKPLDLQAARGFVENILGLCRSSPRIGSTEETTATARIARVDGWGKMRTDPFWPAYCLATYRNAMSLLDGAVEAAAAVTHNEGAEQPGDTRAVASGMAVSIDARDLHQPTFLRKLKNLHSRRPFISATGWVGLCPESAKPGDEIYVFLGGKVPYIVRPCGDRTFSLVGETFVHGIMYGELRQGDVDIEEIILV